MKTLAIDPGYERLGIAVIEKETGGKEVLLFSECFKTDKKLSHPERLGLIKARIEEVISQYQPTSLAIETLFFTNNQKTALLVAEARGAIISTSQTASLKVSEYTPNSIKLAVTGYGKSDKNAIIKMVPQLIKISPEKMKQIIHDDEYDAIAVGLTHFAMQNQLY
jgi:crossover junction endodeoxyribonuclease RuvC